MNQTEREAAAAIHKAKVLEMELALKISRMSIDAISDHASRASTGEEFCADVKTLAKAHVDLMQRDRRVIG